MILVNISSTFLQKVSLRISINKLNWLKSVQLKVKTEYNWGRLFLRDTKSINLLQVKI